ncbi:MAG: hypothetical protein WC025_02300, partial [Candidatus Magasanikbacteria bacterium]
KEFKPLRIAILSQFVFTIILTQLSILVYQYYTNPSRTATMFLTQTNWGGGGLQRPSLPLPYLIKPAGLVFIQPQVQMSTPV